MRATLDEGKAGADHEVAQRSRHENLSGLRQGRNASANVDGQTPHRALGSALHLPDVQPGADLYAERKHAAYDRLGAASICEIQPDTQTRSCGPSPTTWYAIDTPSGVLAYRVSGMPAHLYASYLRSTATAFWPPKPKPFTSAAPTGEWRASLGT